MANPIILASASEIRLQVFQNAGINVTAIPGKIDEDAIKTALVSEGAKPRDIADALAEGKARKTGLKHPGAFTIGCDQVLELSGAMLSKPQSLDNAREQLSQMSGQKHHLHSAAVIYNDGKPIWRHIGRATMHMRDLQAEYIDSYVQRNWDSVRYSVGSYKLEEEGIRLFHRVEGDYFHVLGLPFLEIVNYLIERGCIEG